MATFDELVDETILYLMGMTTLQEQSTYLTAGITASDTEIAVADTAALSRGLIEIGDELIQLDSVNAALLNGTIPPYGRGFRGTTAATHSSGDRVVSAPVLPRATVKRALNSAIESVYPALWGTETATFAFAAGTESYELPAGTVGVLDLKWQDYSIASLWHDVRTYSVDVNANTTSFTNGAAVRIGDFVVPGRTVQVTVKKAPTALSSGSDVFSTVTGLQSSCEDVIRLGAAQRLVTLMDAAHLQGKSAEADFSGASQRNVQTGASLSRSIMQHYQLRLMQESDRLNQLFPVRVRYTR